MSACPQCGTVAKPTDKFCNTCGTPIARAPAPQAAAPYGAQPPQPQGYGAPAPMGGAAPMGGPMGAPAPGGSTPRCQMGHDIAPGASYCAQGHPIALDAMQFAGDAYGGGYGQQAQPPQAYGQQAPQYGGYAAPQPSPSPIGGPGGFGNDPMQQQYGGYAQQAPMGAPAAPQPAMNPQFGQPPQPQYGGAPQPQGYGAQQPQGYGAQQPQAQGYAPQAQQPVFNQAAAPPPPPAPAPAPVPAPAAATTPDPNNKTLRGFLVAYHTNPNGDFWPLTGGRIIVGRQGAGDGIDIQLADPTISSRHAAFVVDGAAGTIALEDTGSTNGTFVNDEHVGFNGRRDLRDGDRVRFGGYTTMVKIVPRF